MTTLFSIVDCNNFFVSCERVFNPKLEGKPVVVLSNNDGCIISRSQEAKSLGIAMGQPYFEIAPILKQHHIHVLSCNHTLYSDMSQRIMNILHKFSSEVEVYSIDECFLNISHIEYDNVENYAQEMRFTIKKLLGIPVTIGIAYTKTLAKLANLVAKNNPYLKGVYSLTDEIIIQKTLKKVDTGKIWGIGKKYKEMLNQNGIKSAYDLSIAPDRWIRKAMSILALKTIYELRGVSCIKLEEEPSAKKGITVSRSFGTNQTDLEELCKAVTIFTIRAVEKLRKENKQAKFISVHIRSSYFSSGKQYSNSIGAELTYPTDFTPTLIEQALKNLKQIFKPGYLYKKAGVMLSDFYDKSDNPRDLLDNTNYLRNDNLMNALDSINTRYGKKTISFAGITSKLIENWRPISETRSKSYTTNWQELIEAK